MPQAAARGSDIGDDLARERTADREEGWPDAGDAPAAAALAPRRGGAPALAAGLLAGRPRRVGAAAARRRTGGMRGRRTGKGGRSRLCVGRPAVIQAHILALRGSEVHGHRRRRDALGWFCAAVSLVAACTGSRRRPRQHPGGDFPADGAGGLGHGRGRGSGRSGGGGECGGACGTIGLRSGAVPRQPAAPGRLQALPALGCESGEGPLSARGPLQLLPRQARQSLRRQGAARPSTARGRGSSDRFDRPGLRLPLYMQGR
mmetsp:Transcript_4546/g.10993  ORF Transcript_4546/g.10993 Transcript_4546/m.10993 type:complete len:260 (+) Transcript_4546:188-967(+)